MQNSMCAGNVTLHNKRFSTAAIGKIVRLDGDVDKGKFWAILEQNVLAATNDETVLENSPIKDSPKSNWDSLAGVDSWDF